MYLRFDILKDTLKRKRYKDPGNYVYALREN